MAKRKMTSNDREMFRAKFEEMTTRDLLVIYREHDNAKAPKYVREAVEEIVYSILRDRGIEFPVFTSLFTV